MTEQNETNMSDVFAYIGNTYSMVLIDQLPTQKQSVELRELQVFLNNIVKTHDQVADDIEPGRRLVGKRGRKPSEESVPDVNDTASVLKAFGRK